MNSENKNGYDEMNRNFNAESVDSNSTNELYDSLEMGSIKHDFAPPSLNHDGMYARNSDTQSAEASMQPIPNRSVVARGELMPDEMRQQAKEANQNLDLLLRNASEIDERTHHLLMKNRTLIQKLFPNKMDRMVLEMQRNTIKEAMEFRMNLYKMSTQFRLEALREKYNASLMSIRGYYRAEVSRFMMQKLFELQANVDVKEREFLDMAKAKYDYAMTLQNYPALQVRYLENIQRGADGYLTFVLRQIIGFEQILDEQIERFR